MKKAILSLFVATFAAFALNAQTPANFTANDCSGNSHDLFAELAAGKVVVISWVMPCGSCLGPTLTASNIVLNYASSNPGQVVMYVADDLANTSCTSLNSWVNNNGITANATFSNSSVNQTPYGSPGMPKIVVLGGGSTPTTYFNQNGTAAGNSTNLQNAINSALAVGINDPSSSINAISFYPNPSTDVVNVSFTLANSGQATVALYNELGQNVMAIFNGSLLTGENKMQFSVAELANGTYFLQVTDAADTRMLKVVVAH